jgi:prepilin-type N-terminal cleavage/methylation domain-containing protein
MAMDETNRLPSYHPSACLKCVNIKFGNLETNFSIWRKTKHMLNAKKGFTLSELLVSLAVLGLIAAFAVPKVLTSVGNSTLLANAKEAIATISGSYEALKADFNGMLPTTMGLSMTTGLPSKMSFNQLGNYTPGLIGTPDVFVQAAAPVAGTHAVRFANNATIAFNPTDTFFTTTPVTGVLPNAQGRVAFEVDPDGVGPNKGFSVILGYDGRVFVPGLVPLTQPFNGYSAAGDPGAERPLITPNAAPSGATPAPPTGAGVDYTPYYNAGMVT